MKMKLRDYELMSRAIDRMLHERGVRFIDVQTHYRDAGLSDERFRWDLFHASKASDIVDFYVYLSDNHIDTGLRRYVSAKAQ